MLELVDEGRQERPGVLEAQAVGLLHHGLARLLQKGGAELDGKELADVRVVFTQDLYERGVRPVLPVQSGILLEVVREQGVHLVEQVPDEDDVSGQAPG